MEAPSPSSTQNGGLGPVSVVVVNWNGAAYLEECLTAVRMLRSDVGEVIVVDNASTDGSVELVRARFPRVRVVSLDKNLGPCPARNAGMRAAQNRWVFALDNDAVVQVDTLARLAAVAGTERGVAIVQPRSVFHTDTSRVHYDGGAFHYVGLIALRNFYMPLGEARGTGRVDVDCAVAVALLVDRDALLAAGGYDESMFILFEDLDLSFRLRASGKRIVSVEDALVLHKGGTAGISFREGPSYPHSRIRLHARNRWIFLGKCCRVRTLVAAAPGLLLYELVTFVFALAAGAAGEWFGGRREAWRGRARIRADRAAFQHARTVRDRDLFVGGPLVITPALAGSWTRRTALAVLDALLRAWWWIARPLSG